MAETFKNGVLNITNSEQDIYTCPGSTTAIVISLRIANVDGSAEDSVTARFLDSDGSTDASLATTVAVPADSVLELAGESKIALEAGDKIKLTGGAASGDLEAFISVLEIT
jgi:hypothetical protein|tara:strand:+ start:641 stop:973 length:333 start_codon:yes stop_codon:yes gene_type:complete